MKAKKGLINLSKTLSLFHLLNKKLLNIVKTKVLYKNRKERKKLLLHKSQFH